MLLGTNHSWTPCIIWGSVKSNVMLFWLAHFSIDMVHSSIIDKVFNSAIFISVFKFEIWFKMSWLVGYRLPWQPYVCIVPTYYPHNCQCTAEICFLSHVFDQSEVQHGDHGNQITTTDNHFQKVHIICIVQV